MSKKLVYVLMIILIIQCMISCMISKAEESPEVEPDAPVQQIDKLIKQLGNEKWGVRHKATEKLLNMGLSILPYLKKHQESPDPEVRLRIHMIIRQIEVNNVKSLRPYIQVAFWRETTKSAGVPASRIAVINNTDKSQELFLVLKHGGCARHLGCDCGRGTGFTTESILVPSNSITIIEHQVAPLGMFLFKYRYIADEAILWRKISEELFNNVNYLVAMGLGLGYGNADCRQKGNRLIKTETGEFIKKICLQGDQKVTINKVKNLPMEIVCPQNVKYLETDTNYIFSYKGKGDEVSPPVEIKLDTTKISQSTVVFIHGKRESKFRRGEERFFFMWGPYIIYNEDKVKIKEIKIIESGLQTAERLVQGNKNKEDLAKYQEIIKDHPYHIETHRDYQNVMRLLGKEVEVKKEYQTKLTKEPDRPMWHYLYGRLLKGEALEAELKKAIELDTKFFWAYYGLGHFYKDNQKWEQAVIHFRKAISINPLSAEAVHGLALVYYAADRLELAEANWQKAMILASDNLEIPLGLAVCYKTKEQYDKAINILSTILMKDPNYWKAYEPLIQCYHAKKDYKKGEELRNKIQELYTQTKDKEFLEQDEITIDIVRVGKALVIAGENLGETKNGIKFIFKVYYKEITSKPPDKIIEIPKTPPKSYPEALKEVKRILLQKEKK